MMRNICVLGIIILMSGCMLITTHYDPKESVCVYTNNIYAIDSELYTGEMSHTLPITIKNPNAHKIMFTYTYREKSQDVFLLPEEEYTIEVLGKKQE